MISNLLNALKSNNRLYAWNMRFVEKNSHQLFFIKQELDMNREVKVTEYYVKIYVKEKDGKLGSSSFIIYPSMSIEEVDAKIKEQIKLCKYTADKPFIMPKKANLKPVSKEVGFNGYSLKEAAFIAADTLFEADKFDKGYINSSEIFINHIETKFYDSNDNIFVYTQEEGQIEFVVTWAEKGQEVELYKFIEFDRLDSNYIQQQASNMLLEASNRFKAHPTPEINNYKLLLTGEYVKELFSHFVYKTSVDAIYSHVSNYDTGKNIQENNKDADLINIRLEPTLKGSTKGAPFDEDGVALKKIHIIEKGVVKNLWGSNNKAQYLNKPVYGRYQNVVVGSGTLETDELEDENFIEIISLSGFDIDAVTGDFGSEIRLAYLHTKNKERQIITGGSIAGNLYDSLDTIRFTKETEQINNYVVPKKVLLEKVSVTKVN